MKTAEASFELALKETNSFKNNEFNYVFNFGHKNINASPIINQIEYSKKFINHNYSEDVSKNFILYSIVAEFLTNSGHGIRSSDFDIKYIQDFKNLFNQVSLQHQCESSAIASSIFISYGILISENDFKEDFLKECPKYISDFEIGFSILQFLSARSYIDVPIDESFKNIATALTDLKPYNKKINRQNPEENKSEVDWETLFKYKGYASLVTFYENKNNYEDWLFNIENAKKFTRVSNKNWIFNAVLAGEIEYWIMNFKKTRTNSLDEKIQLFEEFEDVINMIYEKDISQKYQSNIYFLDAYISYITDVYKKDQNKETFKKGLQFAEREAINHASSEYLLSFIDGQKKTYLDDLSTTKGIVNQNNPLMPNSSSYEQFTNTVEKFYDQEDYLKVIEIVNTYEAKNGSLSMISNPFVTYLKYASFHYLEMYEDAITYNFELIKNFADETFFTSELNFLDSSQSLKNKEKLNEMSTMMIESLFRFQYGKGYDGDKQGEERFSSAYRKFLPNALNMILFAGQISDLNEANHSNKFLNLKNTIKLGLKLTNQNQNLSIDTKKILKNIYNKEKIFIQHSKNFPTDLETLSKLKDDIDQSHKILENSKEIKIIKNKFPEVLQASKPPLVLMQLLGKLNIDEKIIYLKDFGETYFILSLSHAGFDWLHIYNEDMDEINNDILNYKKIISNPRSTFDKKLSHKIFNKLFWTSINVDDMQFTKKIYFINSSNLIDLPLETLIFVEATNDYPDTYLLDYFNFVYLPSIQFFEEITSNKTIAGQMGFEIDSKFIENVFQGFEFTWIEGKEDSLLFDTFKTNDVITKFNGQNINYGMLVGLFHSPSNCMRGLDDWCNFEVSFIRNNQEINKKLSLDNYFQDYENNFVGFGNPQFSQNQIKKDINLALNTLRYSNNQEVENLEEFFELLPPLPETEFEIQHPAAQLNYDKTQTYLGKDASEKNFKMVSKQSTRILSVASHAVSIGDNNLVNEPSIVLSNIKSDGEDGLLKASEIFDLNMNNDLTILSACNTFSNLSDSIHKISGLANSFILAGSNNLMLSRWPVDSEATTYLMTKFYRYIIHANENRFINDYSEALRWAMLEAKAIEEHPFYWSPFLIIGQ